MVDYYLKYLKYKKKYLELKGGAAAVEDVTINIPEQVFNVSLDIIIKLLNYIKTKFNGDNVVLVSVGNTPYKIIKAIEETLSEVKQDKISKGEGEGEEGKGEEGKGEELDEELDENIKLEFSYVPYSGKLFNITEDISSEFKGKLKQIENKLNVIGFEFDDLEDYKKFYRSISKGAPSIQLQGEGDKYSYRPISSNDVGEFNDRSKSIVIVKAQRGNNINIDLLNIDLVDHIKVFRNISMKYGSHVPEISGKEIYGLEFPSVDEGDAKEFVQNNFSNFSMIDPNDRYTDVELNIFKSKLPEFKSDKKYVFIDFTEIGLGFASFLYLCKAVTNDDNFWDNKYVFTINDDFGPESRFNFFKEKLRIPDSEQEEGKRYFEAQIENMFQGKPNWYEVFASEKLNDRCLKSWKKEEWNDENHFVDNIQKCREFIDKLKNFLDKEKGEDIFFQKYKEIFQI